MSCRYAFDNSGHSGLTKDELFFIIHRVEASGYHVVSVSSDGGTKNQGLALALGITPEKPYFMHPGNGQWNEWKIYWFYDAPHILKRCRDHLLDKGFNLAGTNALGNRTFFGKAHLKRLLYKLQDGDDIRIAHKLTDFHLEIREAG